MGKQVADPTSERAIMARVADLLLRHRFQCWFFGDSIGFEGLIRASDLLGDERWASFAYGYFRAWAASSRPYREADNCAPGHAMCMSYERTSDPFLLEALERLAEYLQARRQIEGIFATFEEVPLSRPYGPAQLPTDHLPLLSHAGPGVFVDCMHFDPPFFAHLGALTRRRDLIRLGVQQALAYADLLQDRETGLFHHFYLEQTRQSYILGWSRGQGWALLGLLDLIAVLDDSEPNRADLVTVTRRLADGLRATQREDGHWLAVATASRSGAESSTSAFASAGFYQGMRLGVLSAEQFAIPAERAWHAAMAAVDGMGSLTGVSAAVGAATIDEHYYHVPTGLTVPWGQGPLILAADERRRFEQEK